MADPFSVIAAIGLAANVAQMVDYSLRIVSKSKELRKSLDGAVSEHHHTAVVTASLRGASATLASHLERCIGMERAFGGETQLRELAVDCEGIARSLSRELDRLSVQVDGKNLRWNSFRQALKITWGKGKVDELVETLGMYREELKTEIMMLMLRGQGLTHSRLKDLDQVSKHILYETQTSRQLSEENFAKMLQNAPASLPTPVVYHHETVVDYATRDTAKLQRLLQGGADTEATDNEGYTALIHASGNGHLANVQCLLDLGANTEARNHWGTTSLRAAARWGHLEVVQVLLSRGARLHDLGDLNHATALDNALEKNRWALAEFLLAKGDRVFQSKGELPSKLCNCAEQSDLLGVGVLVKAGVNIDNVRNPKRQTPLSIASDNGYTSVVERLLSAGACTECRDDIGYTALSVAALKGYLNIVRLLLEAGANPNAINKSGWSALAEAGFYGWPEIVDELVAHGAYLETRDEANYTPLCMAAQTGHYAAMERLLKHGANTSAQNQDGWTPLAEACYHGREDIVRLLLENGANTELTGGPDPGEPGPEEGWTPLMRAAKRGQLVVVNMLLDHGGNINAVTSKGRTALTISEPRRDSVYDVLSTRAI